ncbi:histidine phosphotransferase family protein [Zavarzinia aquatilis]|nr:histidine phosphotransferase family protein [Zavarzinia aquatilis]
MTDPLLLAGLLCSRLCHDLVGPVGAVVNGVELLTDVDGGPDEEELRDQSIALVGESANELSARLRLFRLAFGAAADGSIVSHDEIAEVLLPVMQGRRIAATIDGAREGLDRAKARIGLLMALIGADCLPRGGRLNLSFGPGRNVVVTSAGDRCVLPAAHAAVFGGDDAGIEPRTAPVVYALGLAAQDGGSLTCAAREGTVELRLA